jgi:hypothetical protein
MSTRGSTRTPHRHVVTDPRSGQVVELPAGSCLVLKFAPRGHATSHWRIADRPGHLLPLGGGRFELQFLVFGTGSAPAPLRLVRSCDDCGTSGDVRDVTVIATAS